MTARSSERSDYTAPHDDSRRFAWALAAVTVAALGVRVAYVLTDRANIKFGGDAYFYHVGANLLAQGHGFIEPFFYHLGQNVQAADHPPLYLLFLSIPSFFGMTSSLTHLLWSCVLGTATIVVVGLLGRAVANARVGIMAAVIAAIYPNLWIPDGSLAAETAAIFATALTLLLAYRYFQRPSWQRLVAVGAACAAAALTRAELILLVPFIVLPLALLTRTLSFRQQLRWLGTGVLAALVVVAPWVAFNITRFNHPVYLSSNFEALLASANCDSTYSGSLLGYFSLPCALAYQHRYHIGGDQSQQAIGFRRAAIDYISHHEGRLPVVVAARLGRIVEVFRPGQNLSLREFLDHVEKSIARAALFSFYALALLSLGGVVILRRRRMSLFPLLAPIAVVLVTVAITYATPRFRTSAEVVLTVLAAVALDALVSRIVAARRAGRDRRTLAGAGRAGEAPTARAPGSPPAP
jgi:4-amino-4-deoxy-L-arabinose transferase-like glycosyltransferase